MEWRLLGKSLFRNRLGTAEIVGTTLFLVVLLFLFTNVILWYDTSARQAESIVVDKINSPVSMTIYQYPGYGDPLILRVRSTGVKDVRIVGVRWVEAINDNHEYIDIKRDLSTPVLIQSGLWIDIIFTPGGGLFFNPENRTLTVDFTPSPSGEVMFKALTDLGNMAVYTFTFP
jgi:hypothetical protein